jgi:amidophosphoribosyltransferase
MVEQVAKDLGVTTLRYQTVEDMIKAIGLAKESLCLYCWTGECPKKKPDTARGRFSSTKLRAQEPSLT